MNPADVLCELPCQICEFLFLKLPCCMKRVRKSKEIELAVLSLKHVDIVDLIMDFFIFSSTPHLHCGFDFEVNCCH